MLEFTKEELIGFIGLVFIIFLFGLSGKIESEYTMQGTITDMYETNLVITDVRGHDWVVDREFDLENVYYLGDEVKVTFDNRHTDMVIEDDVVLKIERR